jgi:hypothetical protein
MNQEKIIQAIAAYLENADWGWRLPASTSAEKIARELAAAIAPHLKAGAGEQALKACKIVVDGYEGDDMENMSERDNLFFRECKKACTFTS